MKFVGVQSLIVLAIEINCLRHLPLSKSHKYSYQALSQSAKHFLRAWSGPPILALVIGINEYTSPLPCLQGAVADADAFRKFLKERLNVPDANIINLRNKEASRKSIISELNSLRDNSSYKKDEAAIIIFYAGHGALTKIPKKWALEGWNTSNGHIEMLCPSDISCLVNGEESVIQGIPDRTISVVLNQIAKSKGNNIVSVFDSSE